MDTYFAAAYWAARRESATSCAARASDFLGSLSDVSEHLSGWRPPGRSRRAAKGSPPIDYSCLDALFDLFNKGRNRRDDNQAVIDELGYSAQLWNGGNNLSSASLMLGCGISATVPGLSNAIVLTLPSVLDVHSDELLKAILGAFVASWDPDWAIVSSETARSQNIGDHPFLDRVLYVKDVQMISADLRVSGKEEQMGDGLLFLATSET